jgi:N-acetylglucosaminyl-diphospho-decaprenol L-rhamnosyltransferase
MTSLLSCAPFVRSWPVGVPIKMSARWSVITVTKDSAGDLRQFWNSDIPDNVEWIVVDNASTDGSVELARELGATIVVPLKENRGFAAACNVGLSLATAELTAFANPDVEVRYKELGKFSEILAVEEVLIAPQLLYPNGKIQHNGRGNPHLSNKVLGRLNTHPVSYTHLTLPTK